MKQKLIQTLHFVRKKGKALIHLVKKSPLFPVRKRDRIIVGVASLIIVSSVIWYFSFVKQAISAEWFDKEYGYRQRIPITNAGSTLANFQVGFTLNTSSLVSAGKMQSDCDDLRVVGENGEVLPYWIQEQTGACNTTTTRIWTKIPAIPTTGINIYVYYGNPTASGIQNGRGVFEFFDDFNGAALDTRWGTQTHASGTGASYNIVSGTISFTTTTTGGYMWLYSTTPITQPYWMEVNVRNNYATSGNVVRIGQSKAITRTSSGNYFSSYSMDDAGNSTLRIVGDSSAGGFAVTSTANATTSGIWRFAWPATSSQLAFLNDTSVMTGTNASNPYASQYLYLGSPANTTTGTVSLDWVFARKYAATAPVVGTFASEEKTPGPISYWKFDEGSGTSTYDTSGRSNTGTLTNGPTWQTGDMCLSEKCIFFDATNDYVDTTTDLSWTTADSFTMEVWVKPIKSGTEQGLFGKGFTSGYEYRAGINTDQTLNFVYWDTGGQGILSLSSTERIIVGEWNHYAVTYDGSAGYMYLNGKKVAEDTSVSGTFIDRSTAFTIGQTYWNASKGGRFRGYMDEFKIYNYARSANQIASDYVKGAAAAGSQAVLGRSEQNVLNDQLAAYWKMDETTWVGANAVLDSSGNAISGTAVGGAGITAPGKFGNGGRFDGVNDYVDIPDTTLSGEFTISFWWNITASAAYRMALGRDTSGGSNKIGHNNNGTTFLVRVVDGGDLDDNSVALPGNGSWHHIVITRNKDNKVDLIVNGGTPNRLFSDVAQSGDSTWSVIGRSDASNGQYINGRLDEIRFYNHAFTTREVSQLYSYAPGPVAYWDFNENTSTTANDKSGNGFTGTITGAEWAAGKYGSALRFNGVDYVNIASPAFPGIAGHITLSMWVNGDAAIQPQNDSVFEGVDSGSSRVLNAHLPWSNGTIYWDAGRGNPAPTYDRINLAAPVSSYEGEWNHWTFTKNIDTGSMKIYLNGVVFHSGVGATSPISTVSTFRIGSYANGTTNYDGLIDDFRIYNYERTPKQIIQDMNAGHPSVGSPVASPVAYWKLDEGYGTTINNAGSAGSTLNGTFATGTSAPTWTNDGKFGKALAFDGTSDYLTVNDNNALDTSDNFTVSIWANPSTYQGRTQQQGFMISKGIYPTYNYRLLTDSSSGNRFEFGTNIGSAGFTSLSTKRTFSTNTWYNIVGTYNGSKMQIYINGVLDNNVAVGGTVNVNTTALYIGKYSNGGGYEYKGSLDEAKVYNYALTDDEIKTEYNRGKAIVLGSNSTDVGGTRPGTSASREYCVPGDTATCTSPVAEWLFNENIGTTAYDTGSSRNGGFGTGGSAPTWGPGFQGSGVRFDGTGDLIDTSTELSFSSATSFSVSGWINPTVLGAVDRYVMDRTTGTNELINIFVPSNSSSLSFRLRGDDGVGLVSATAPSVVTVGKWLHFTGVRDVSDDTLKIYINGRFISQATDTTTGTNSPIIRIGNHSGAANGWFGLIDQIRIYNYARTQAQIAWEYSKGAPVAHYKMDECEGATIYNSAPTYNDLPAGNNGTLTIGASGTNTTVGTCSTSGAWADGATGKRGASMDFDGTDDYIAITDSALFDVIKEVSYAAWIKPNGTKSGLILNKFASGAEDKQLTLNTTGEILFYLYNWSGSSLTSTATVTFGQWNHVVATYNGTTATIYINGKNAGSKTASSSDIADSTGDFYIGENAARGGVSGDGMGGSIDDVRIYNYTLTPHQVKTVYNNGAVNFE